jgi:biotin carboxyl carrier protein
MKMENLIRTDHDVKIGKIKFNEGEKKKKNNKTKKNKKWQKI